MTPRPHVSRETAAGVAHRVISSAVPGLPTPQLERLASLVGLVCSTPVGITAIRDPAEAAARHVLDALSGLPAVDAAPSGPLADVGSGGGLPGLVLATMRPDREIASDRGDGAQGGVHRRGGGRARTGRDVHAERSEELGRGECCAMPAPAWWRGRSRRPLSRWSSACRSAVRAAGSCCGHASTADDELAFAATALGGRVLDAECPGVLVIGALAETPERFPRRPGMAAKRPLSGSRSDRPRR